MNRFSLLGKPLAVACFGLASMTTTASAFAEGPPLADVDVREQPSARPPPVDVVVREQPSARRVVAIDWNPLTVFIAKVSVDIVIVPVNHHALVLVPFYASTTTAPLATANTDANGTIIQLPQQSFWGFGGEIGYRYYSAVGGPRGFFAGPSFLVGAMTAKAANGAETSFQNYGFALDVGYEALVADRIALVLGGGAQYQVTSKSIPDQELPASLYANRRFAPRVLLALGVAF
jgi:hypothetical protein